MQDEYITQIKEEKKESIMTMRYSVMIVDDPTGPHSGLCGNIHGMCCNPEGATQKELVTDASNRYGEIFGEKAPKFDELF